MTPAGVRAAALAVVIAAIAINAPSLVPGFIHDDHRIIEQNAWLGDLAHLPEIFRRGYWSVDRQEVPNLYRPVTIASFALDHAAGGLRPLGYRLVNLLLHALVSLLVFFLARRLLEGPPGGGTGCTRPALFAALLFAVHPVHTEVLGEVVGRAELLAAALTLGCLLAFLRGRDARQPAGWWLLATICFAAGFLAKENAIAAPALVLLADLLIVRRRIDARPLALLAGAALACLVLRGAVLGGLNPPGFVHPIDNPIAHAPFVQGRLTAVAVLGRYAGLLLLPLRQSIDYSFDAIPLAGGPFDAAVMAGGLVLGIWIAALLIAWKRSPRVAFGLAFIGVALAPVANLVMPIGTIMAERLLYLPSVGLCLLGGCAARGLAASAGGRRRPGVVVVAGLLLLAGLSARSVGRLRDWRDDYTIFRAAVGVEPRSVRAQFNYGSACEDRGHDDEATKAYEAALEVWPAFTDARYNLAGVLARRQDWAGAAELYRAVIGREPGNVKALVNLGHALTGEGRPGEAVEALRRALALDPRSAQAHTNLGAAHLALGEPREAIEAYTGALQIDPGNPRFLLNLALAQQRAGDRPGAIDSARRALTGATLDPEITAACGMLLLASGDAAGGLLALRRAVEESPAQPVYHYQLGRALEVNGRAVEAGQQYREAIRLAPGVPLPLRNLGMLLYRQGDRAGALRALLEADRLDTRGTVLDDEARAALADLRRTAAR